MPVASFALSTCAAVMALSTTRSTDPQANTIMETLARRASSVRALHQLMLRATRTHQAKTKLPRSKLPQPTLPSRPHHRLIICTANVVREQGAAVVIVKVPALGPGAISNFGNGDHSLIARDCSVRGCDDDTHRITRCRFATS
jgi:hypothetical protein